MSFNIEDLVFAYKKAKVDFYYSSNIVLEQIARYEDNLFKNLNNLLNNINDNNKAYFESDSFLGEWTLAPKGINIKNLKEMKSDVIHSSPSEHWAHICNYGEKNPDDKPTAEFRVMAACSMDFHVLSGELCVTDDAGCRRNFGGFFVRSTVHHGMKRFMSLYFDPIFSCWRTPPVTRPKRGRDGG